MLSRRNFVLTTAGLTLGGVLAPAAFARSSRRPRANDERFFAWIELAPGVWATNDLDTGGNAMVIAGSGSAALIDSKFPAFGAQLRAEGEAVAGEPITQLINTHHHGDHTSGNAAVGAVAVRIAHAKAEPRIASQLDRYVEMTRNAAAQFRGLDHPAQSEAMKLAEKNAGGADALRASHFTPTRAIDPAPGNPTKIENGALAIHAYHFGGGHTDNDTVLVVADRNVIHTGDLVFAGRHPYFDQSGGGSARGWLRSLEGILALCDAETKVLPGHGKAGGREIVQQQIDYHVALIDAVTAEVRKGTAKERAHEMTWPFMDGLEGGQIRPRAIGAVYDEIKAELERR